jgi:hypothetical protein
LDTLLIAGDITRREKHNGSITTMDTRRYSNCHSGWLMIANAEQTQQANAVELTVLSAGAMRAALAELAPLFGRSSGHKLIIEYGMVGKVEERWWEIGRRARRCAPRDRSPHRAGPARSPRPLGGTQDSTLA